MNLFKKRATLLFSTLFILSTLLGWFPPLVQGGTLPAVEVVVQGPTGEMLRGSTEELKGVDALKAVLADQGKEAPLIQGGMLVSLMGLSNALDWSSYWYTAIHRNNGYVEVTEGINDLVLQPGDRFIVYYSAPDTLTANQLEYSTTSPGKSLTITLNNRMQDWMTSEWVVTPLQSPNLKAWIDDQPVTVAGNRIILEAGLPLGEHRLQIKDYASDGLTIPKVVEDTFFFSILNPTCQVRVEGLTNTMVQGTAQGATLLELVKKLLEAKGVSYTLNPNYGGYITEIGGLAEKDIAPYTGWMYYIKSPKAIITPEVGMGSYIPDDGDEVVLYFTDFQVPYVNTITFTPDIVPVMGPLSMRFAYRYTDWSDWAHPIEVVKPISSAVVTLDETNYITDEGGTIQLPLGFAVGVHTYKISGYNSDALNRVVMDQGTFFIDGVHSPSLNYSQSSFEDSLDRDNLLILKDIPMEIRKTAPVVATYSDPWAYMSLRKLGLPIDFTYLEVAYRDLRRNGVKEYTTTELEKLIFGLKAGGYSPENFAGLNLVEELLQRNPDNFALGDVLFGLLVMEYGHLPEGNPVNRASLRNRLMKLRIEDQGLTGWSLGTTIDADITGAALNALAPALLEEGVRSLVEEAVKSLATLVSESGYVSGFSGISSETNAFVLMGLVAVGINPEGVTQLSDGTQVNFARSKGDLVSALLSFKTGAGAFRHTLEGSGNSMATEQVLRALIALDRYKSTGKAYNFYSSETDSESVKVYRSTTLSSEGFSPSGLLASTQKTTLASEAMEVPRVEGGAVQRALLTETKTKNQEQSSRYFLLGGGLVLLGLLGGGSYLWFEGKKRSKGQIKPGTLAQED